MTVYVVLSKIEEACTINRFGVQATTGDVYLNVEQKRGSTPMELRRSPVRACSKTGKSGNVKFVFKNGTTRTVAIGQFVGSLGELQTLGFPATATIL